MARPKSAKYRWRDQTERSLLRRYGINKDGYNALFQAQNGKCAICGNPPKSGRNFDVDHDHTTGRIRGLLCNNCNRGIGHLKDDATIIRKAADYLER